MEKIWLRAVLRVITHIIWETRTTQTRRVGSIRSSSVSANTNPTSSLRIVQMEVLTLRTGTSLAAFLVTDLCLIFNIQRMASLYTTSISIDNSPIYVTRQGVYGMSYPFSPRFSSRYLEDRINTTYTCHSVIFGGPLIIQLRIGRYTYNL